MSLEQEQELGIGKVRMPSDGEHGATPGSADAAAGRIEVHEWVVDVEAIPGGEVTGIRERDHIVDAVSPIAEVNLREHDVLPIGGIAIPDVHGVPRPGFDVRE